MNLETVKAKIIPLLPYLVILAGLGLLTLSLIVDFIGLGSGDGFGFGVRQLRLFIVGSATLMVGILVVPPIRRNVLLKWLMPSVAYRYPGSVLARTGRIMVLSAWFGLILGIVGWYQLAEIKLFLKEPIGFAMPSVVWMVVIAGLVISGFTGVVLSLVARRWPNLISLRVALVALLFPVFCNVVLMILDQIHFAATLVLALGFSLVAAKLISTRPDRFYGLVWRTGIPMAAVAMVLPLALSVQAYMSEQRALAALPAADAGKPNVLLVTLDTVRARSLSLYGYDRPTTPNLEQFARKSVTFDWAMSTSPWTLPAHGSMFTGRFAHELSATWTVPLDDTYPTLAEVLSSQGYETAGFTANFSFGIREMGLGRGMIRYEDLAVSPWEIARSSLMLRKIFDRIEFLEFPDDMRLMSRKNAEQLSDDFSTWLNNREDPGRPFLAFINYFDAHDPYDPPADFAIKFSGKPDPVGVADWYAGPPENLKELNDAYDAAIAYLDQQVSLLLEDLERRDLLNNTLVIITSDHGEHFGEHGLMLHGNSLYLPVLHVPLVISFPNNMPSDIRVSEPVSLRDIPTTVIDLLGLKEEEGVFPGRSLARYWSGGNGSEIPGDDIVLSEVAGQSWVPDRFPNQKGDMKSLILDQSLYVRNGDGQEELYDIEKDPP